MNNDQPRTFRPTPSRPGLSSPPDARDSSASPVPTPTPSAPCPAPTREPGIAPKASADADGADHREAVLAGVPPIDRSSLLDPRGRRDFARIYAAAYPRLMSQFEANVAALAAVDPGRASAYSRSARPLPPGLPPGAYPPWCFRNSRPLQLPLYPVKAPYSGSPRQIDWARRI